MVSKYKYGMRPQDGPHAFFYGKTRVEKVILFPPGMLLIFWSLTAQGIEIESVHLLLGGEHRKEHPIPHGAA